MNSVSPHSSYFAKRLLRLPCYFVYPEDFVPRAAMIVNSAFLLVGCGVSDQTLGL